MDSEVYAKFLGALSFESREAFDAVTKAAAASGGSSGVRGRQDLGFLYFRGFGNPDGHRFEPISMDVAGVAGNSLPDVGRSIASELPAPRNSARR